MKCMKVMILCLLIMKVPMSRAQESEQPPFIFTLYGGLFFPSNENYSAIFKSHSEAIWGFGACLPVVNSLFLTGDVSYFRAEAFVQSANESTAILEERFIHIGLLHKQSIEKRVYLRFSGGLNYVTIRQKYSSAQTPERSVEADKTIGYFGGCGLEESLEDGRMSFFVDVVYDYRRVPQKELEGDYGGVRVVLGAHLFLF